MDKETGDQQGQGVPRESSEMRVFVSWSGERSKVMALALRDWLPLVLHYARPWLSERDIQAGQRWTLEVGTELEASNFGVICLTKDNLEAPWILFEAGAISKAISAASVCPYLLDAEFRDISGPLSQFQAKKADKESTLELVQAINERATKPVDGTRLLELFEALWPRLEQKLARIPDAQARNRQAARSEPEILEELVETVRTLDRRFRNLESTINQLQFSSSAPSTSASRDMHAGETQHRLITVVSDIDGTKFPKGEPVHFELDDTRKLVFTVADAFELDRQKFMDAWYLLDGRSNKHLGTEELFDLDKHFGDLTPLVKISYLPF